MDCTECGTTNTTPDAGDAHFYCTSCGVINPL